MKKVLFLLMPLLMLAGIAKAQTVKQLTEEQFKKVIWDFTADKEWKFKGDKPVILDLYADWCPPCKKLAPILDELQKNNGDKIQIYKINVDKERTLAQLFAANSIPLMIFIPTKGEPSKVVGLLPLAELQKLVDEKLLKTKK